MAAANQYGASSFSVPSRLVFANPRSPGPPREFKVIAIETAKDHVQVNLAWKKPINSVGKKKFHKLKVFFVVIYLLCGRCK